MVTFLELVEQVLKKKISIFRKNLENFSKTRKKIFFHNLFDLFQKRYHSIPSQILHFLEVRIFEIGSQEVILWLKRGQNSNFFIIFRKSLKPSYLVK